MHKTEMGLQKMHNQDMGLILSTEAKPRLKWTPELHQRFIDAVTQLGGAERATPKTLMRVMSIPGLTLYHLKSHLQKYRLGKNQQSESCNDNEQEDSTELDFKESNIGGEQVDEEKETMDRTYTQNNESLQIVQALQMQMEVQKKLQEQIEVQRRLQMRIEAQGKYLQSILRKAQETLSTHCFSPIRLDAAKDEVSNLVSMVDNLCPSPSLSGLTETSGFWLKSAGKRTMRGTDGSTDSLLTSSESYGRKYEKLQKLKSGDTTCAVPPLMEMNSYERNMRNDDDSRFQLAGRRSGSPFSDESCVEQPLLTKLSPPHQQKPASQLLELGLAEDILDLNSKYQSETGSGRQEFDLNS